jgi:hypothetical protein
MKRLTNTRSFIFITLTVISFAAANAAATAAFSGNHAVAISLTAAGALAATYAIWNAHHASVRPAASQAAGSTPRGDTSRGPVVVTVDGETGTDFLAAPPGLNAFITVNNESMVDSKIGLVVGFARFNSGNSEAVYVVASGGLQRSGAADLTPKTFVHYSDAKFVATTE